MTNENLKKKKKNNLNEDKKHACFRNYLQNNFLLKKT